MDSGNTQPTYKRQRFLLSFIRQLDGGVSATDLQKLVFLHTMRERVEYYEFLPYKFGAYSFQLAEDVNTLRRDGYLTDEGTRVNAAGTYLLDNLFTIETERGNALLRKAYREYPYFTINSDMIDTLFSREEAARLKNERQQYVQTEYALFTIGYEGLSIEAFINVLIQNGITLLCDVRLNPLSRKFGFSKGKLEHITGMVGIKYVHIPDLGIESDKRRSLETVEDYEDLFADYAETFPQRKAHLDRVYSLLCSDIRIALMCFEKDAAMCHRHIIRDFITDEYEVRSKDL